MWKLIGALLALVVTVGVDAAAQQKPVDPNQWEPAIQKFEAEDKAESAGQRRRRVHRMPPASRGGATLPNRFPSLKVVNSGFGGSEMADSATYAARVVLPHAPRIVVLYAGENDLNRGVSPDDD